MHQNWPPLELSHPDPGATLALRVSPHLGPETQEAKPDDYQDDDEAGGGEVEGDNEVHLVHGQAKALELSVDLHRVLDIKCHGRDLVPVHLKGLERGGQLTLKNDLCLYIPSMELGRGNTEHRLKAKCHLANSDSEINYLIVINSDIRQQNVMIGCIILSVLFIHMQLSCMCRKTSSHASNVKTWVNLNLDSQ